jgi:hypothetical protein
LLTFSDPSSSPSVWSGYFFSTLFFTVGISFSSSLRFYVHILRLTCFLLDFASFFAGCHLAGIAAWGCSGLFRWPAGRLYCWWVPFVLSSSVSIVTDQWTSIINCSQRAADILS